jgi:hypothetical protein
MEKLPLALPVCMVAIVNLPVANPLTLEAFGITIWFGVENKIVAC